MEPLKTAIEPETVPIPAGPFLMGSPPGEGIPGHETPQHPVELPVYRIGKYPVTQRQYAEFIKRGNQQHVPGKKAGWFGLGPPKAKLDHPVVEVSWHAARAYCDWLSRETGQRYRLPTKAEWEKAARGPEGRLYPWGNTWEAGRCHQGGDDTASVDAYPAGASVYGCYDMLGNVQEWTSTLWGSDPNASDFPYPYNSRDGREELEVSLFRVYRIHRGGCYRDEPARLRCSVRGCSPPDSKVPWRGLRVVLETRAELEPDSTLDSEQRRRQELAGLQQQWELLSRKLAAMEEERILETRAEEKLRLDYKINQARAEREKVASQLDALEARLRP